MRVVFFFLFVWILLELSLLIWIGGQIGGILTIALLILSSFIGGKLWRKYSQNLAVEFTQMGTPNHQIQNSKNLTGLIAGIFLMIPGFISDVVALFLLLPFFRNRLKMYYSKIFRYQNPQNSDGHQSKNYGHRADGSEINGEFIDHNDK